MVLKMNEEQKGAVAIITLATLGLLSIKIFYPISWLEVFLPIIGAIIRSIGAWFYLRFILE
jgi:hypothetical protein